MGVCDSQEAVENEDEEGKESMMMMSITVLILHPVPQLTDCRCHTRALAQHLILMHWNR